VELVTGAGGIFDVHVDGDLVFTKSMLGRYPDPDDVLPLLRSRIAG
jgi:predicted Rdx family selenoprotein